MSLLAFDIGSSRCKAALFTAEGKTLAEDVQTYTPEFPEPSYVEMDAEKFWDAICRSARTLKEAAARDPVQALSISSHGESFVAVGADGAAVAPAILNIDARASREAQWLEAEIGRRRLFNITGLVMHPMFSIPKILWLQRHRPEVTSSAKRFLNVTAYLLCRLGLPPYIDYSLASRFFGFDAQRQCWSEEILSAAGLKKEFLPVAVPAGSVAGELASESASRLGVPAGTKVVVGGHDQACGALGAGVISPGLVAASMGTYECIAAVSDEARLGDEAFAASLNCYAHVVPGKYLTLAYFPSGIMIQWFHDLLFKRAGGSSADAGNREERVCYDSLESAAPKGPSGLFVMPHLIGSCTPDFNPRARAAVIGLGHSSDAGQIYKGILEGLACELAQASDLVAKAVCDFRDFYVTGGGAHSPLGLKLRAAFTGRRLHVMECEDPVCLGSAILAGAAAGIYPSITGGVSQAVREREVIEPDPVIKASYAGYGKQYWKLYSAILSLREADNRSEQGER